MCSLHIDKLSDRHQGNTDQHHDDANGHTGSIGERIEAVEKLCKVSCNKRVDDRAIPDLFLQDQIDDQETDADKRHRETEIQRRMVRDTHAETVPRPQTDVCKDG